MATLTLARYILETSLMFLNFCRVQESLISAACFSLALRMRKLGDWVWLPIFSVEKLTFLTQIKTVLKEFRNYI